EKDLGSALGVAQQMINILTEQNVQRSIKELRAQDILIAPTLDGIGFLDFHNVEGAIGAGHLAAMSASSRLAPLALSKDDYALYENNRLAPPPLSDEPVRVAQLKVESVGKIAPKVLEVQSGIVAGQSYTREQVRQAAAGLYGRGDVERIETDVDDDGGKRVVSIKATEARWASSRLRVGLELASDFDDANSFALKLMHVKTSLNDWGGELRTVMRVGDQRDLGMQLYQPLGAGSPWYVAPSTQYNSASLDAFSEGRRISRYAYTGRSVSMVLGRQLGTWGDLQLGLTRQLSGVRAVIPEAPIGQAIEGYGTTQFVRYRVDTLDSLGFPSRGSLFDARIERVPGGLESGAAVARSSLLGMSALSTENWAGHVYGEFAHSQSGAAPLSLGGFLRLSGTVPDSIQGRSVVFSRLVMARRVGALPVTLGGVVRAGFSLEAGGGFDLSQPGQGSLLKTAGSVFLSVDTRFGPAYVGAGATKDGNKTMYLFLGPIW
ncbi:MAG: patatin domain-containing protein, partial [Massilia sp.]